MCVVGISFKFVKERGKHQLRETSKMSLKITVHSLKHFVYAVLNALWNIFLNFFRALGQY